MGHETFGHLLVWAFTTAAQVNRTMTARIAKEEDTKMVTLYLIINLQPAMQQCATLRDLFCPLS